jgi:hypothetical protein
MASTREWNAYGTGGASEFAIGMSTASQLPGRDSGPADAFRHMILSAELTRRFGESAARGLLNAHELGERGADSAQDRYVNDIGITLGKFLARNNGQSSHVVDLVTDYFYKSLSKLNWRDVTNGGSFPRDPRGFLIAPGGRSVCNSMTRLSCCSRWASCPIRFGNKIQSTM